MCSPYAVIVTEFDSAYDLPNGSFCGDFVESRRISLQIVENRVIDELEDEKESFLASKNVQKIDEILVAKLLGRGKKIRNKIRSGCGGKGRKRQKSPRGK